MMSGAGQNQSKMMLGANGPNITGTVPLGPTIAKAISSQVHVSLANASTTAEKAVGANAHAGSGENWSSPWIFSIHGLSPG